MAAEKSSMNLESQFSSRNKLTISSWVVCDMRARLCVASLNRLIIAPHTDSNRFRNWQKACFLSTHSIREQELTRHFSPQSGSVLIEDKNRAISSSIFSDTNRNHLPIKGQLVSQCLESAFLCPQQSHSFQRIPFASSSSMRFWTVADASVVRISDHLWPFKPSSLLSLESFTVPFFTDSFQIARTPCQNTAATLLSLASYNSQNYADCTKYWHTVHTRTHFICLTQQGSKVKMHVCSPWKNLRKKSDN